MPKTSKSDAFFGVGKTPQIKFFATDDLVLTMVRIDQSDKLARQGTIQDLIQLGNFLKRGWRIVATTSQEGVRYFTIIYTLYKPLDE